MRVYENKYWTVDYFADKGLIVLTWLQESYRMTDNEYKDCFLAYAEITEKFKPTRNISDVRDMKFLITPELQEWTNEVVFSRFWAVGLRKVAFVTSKVMLAQMSVEQTMEEETGSSFEFQYFDTIENAEKWVLGL
ncbi:MAG: hypothetical protein EAZ57_09375 [Cytophagales bacterium]|nr:MAG: hypothetical protein EAZ67_10180 [Cytophagales bacterium]TAF59977.1 MAG: hypothetical protein EAZ57_09375 [Cytophagales bacterium]